MSTATQVEQVETRIFNKSQREAIETLERLTDWLRNNELPADVNVLVDDDIALFTRNADSLRQARRLVGPMDKEGGNGQLVLRGVADNGAQVKIFPQGSTCKKVQVGVEEVEVEEPVETITRTVARPVYEWDCGPVLAGEGSK